MPRGDGTGPMGQGAKTGKGSGNCQPTENTKRTGFGFGRGAGRGKGNGLGRLMFWKQNNSDK